ncbi:putative nucleoside-diphosphate-sugar epimerase [Aspergillus ruber CBS 135680]|uniref:NAD(P)-binding domain-containing protein n=1 Tax=Aspergillus ruber (strain CBS 135680) TaxID=1388766 RepID=A0A017SDX8_ASPRC|nr:uncharacterized protein EURHEDRAFT_500935 [Aspergillus ruber CBS 135680]EYE94844.1 hypothetical protein EURHEDRAFT_500935 [Aspergillus ruber CBS 135680]
MKIILLGSTGFIGKEVLNQCLETPAITSLIALSRRDLPEAATNPKLTVVIMEHFNSYPDSVLEQLKGADACIWSIGTYDWDPVVEIEYPEAFQKALLKVLDAKKTFRYIYLGGAFTEPDQEKSLWFFSEGRHVRGLAQTNFLEFGKQNQNVKTYVVRPAAVLAKNGSALLRCLLWIVSVRTDELAAVMADLAVNGGDEQVVGNEVIVDRGRKLIR